ncbi:serine/threonine-protein kinase [Micromonosporaceae bacterium Da 78-11]
MTDDWPVPGALLAARYRLVSLLEIGGMAEIWRADDELLGRPVAVKLQDGPLIAWREARMAARLSHPGIAAVHDYREAVRPDGTLAPFVVMELLAGETVAARLVRAPIGWPETARVGSEVARALAAAHARGVVHRDIKPGNVMLTPTGVKILDFGISAAAGEPDDDDTGATFGTPAYVAPERLDGKPAEPATDVYGLGVLLFEMVTGQPPYPVETWEELAAARTTGPGVLPDDLPAAFREVVDRCLQEEPRRRPGTDEVQQRLAALAPPTEPPVPHRAFATGRAPAATLAMAAPPRRPIPLVLAAVALLVAAGGAVAALTWPDHDIEAGKPPAPTTSSSRPPRTEATSTPATAPTSAGPTTSAAPRKAARLTFDDAVVRLRSAVDAGASGGQIRSDVATDLRNLVQNLNNADSAQVTGQVDQMRRKIRQRVGEGSLTPARAAVLQSRLTDLDRAAGA